MTKEKAIEVAKKYFPNYPSVDTFHVTHDGQVFANAQHADNHARSAFKKDEERMVQPVTREEADAANDDKVAKAKVVALAKAQKNVEALTATVAKKEQAVAAAKTEAAKASAQKELEAAQVELQTAEAVLKQL